MVVAKACEAVTACFGCRKSKVAPLALDDLLLDPKVLLTYGTHEFESSTMYDGGSNLMWRKDDEAKFTIPRGTWPPAEINVVKFDVNDENLMQTDILIGSGELRLDKVNSPVKHGEYCPMVVKLEDEDGYFAGQVTVEVRVTGGEDSAGDQYLSITIVKANGLRDVRKRKEVVNVKGEAKLAKIAGIVLLLYFAIGTIFYTFMEGALVEGKTSNFYDAFYFCVATLTTVGYGDMGPTTVSTRLFTCFYVLIGLSNIGVCLGIVVGIVLDHQQVMMKAATDAASEMADDALQLAIDLEEAASNQLIGDAEEVPPQAILEKNKVPDKSFFSEEMRSALNTVLQLALVIVVGAVFISFAEDIPIVDGLYFATITATTVGYGDFSPSEAYSRMICIPYMLIAVLMTARALSSLGDITLGARRREAKAKLLARYEKTLSLHELDLICRKFGGPDGRCQKLEFVIAMLIDEGSLQENDVKLASAKFLELDKDKSGFLGVEDCLALETTDDDAEIHHKLKADAKERELTQIRKDEQKLINFLEKMAATKAELEKEMATLISEQAGKKKSDLGSCEGPKSGSWTS